MELYLHDDTITTQTVTGAVDYFLGAIHIRRNLLIIRSSGVQAARGARLARHQLASMADAK